MQVRDGRAVVTFDHATGGLVARGPALEGFEIAGADRQFVPARAEIDGGMVIVWSDRVAEPLAVRYAWKDDPDATLYNRAGLPAVPFRTDNWPREP
jgi:sialate O-acetylesterase